MTKKIFLLKYKILNPTNLISSNVKHYFIINNKIAMYHVECHISWDSGCRTKLFYFLLPTYCRERIVLGQIFEMEIFIGLLVFRCSETENHIFSDWSMNLCVCYQHNPKTNNRRNSKFSILNLHHLKMFLETFKEDVTNSLCAGPYKQKNCNASRPMVGISF